MLSSAGRLAKGTELLINAQGLEGSLRAAQDGVTYFGCNVTLPTPTSRPQTQTQTQIQASKLDDGMVGHGGE